MYRVDGVSGLNVLTGIKSKNDSSGWGGKPSILSLLGSVIGLHPRCPLLFRAEGTRRISAAFFRASVFLKFFDRHRF
jgi:hypothetical protein